VIYKVISNTQARGYAEGHVPPDVQLDWNGYRSDYWRAPLAYPARPLAGIWATSPFLHNGSVPNLYELLSPVEERSGTFYLGNPEFDPKRVGYESGRFRGGSKLDTTVTGNSNAGHEFDDGGGNGVIGRKLTEEERWDLIEFLKALRFEDEVPPAVAPPTGWPQNPGGAAMSKGDNVPNTDAPPQPSATPAVQ
ncbi:MAG TPA: di-heme-cytochrome C peroxidase, partial [Thermoanaerobaculia bacterium]|nr:di-heme-cytochrome C peroxidase [Thermoanaerobaculia bacterium]